MPERLGAVHEGGELHRQRRATTGSPMPAALLRITTESITARAVRPKIGREGRTDAHASATRPSARGAGSWTPDRSMRARAPTRSTPAAMLLTARTATASEGEGPGPSVHYPTNISARLPRRVSTVFHVPCGPPGPTRSPPTMLVDDGEHP